MSFDINILVNGSRCKIYSHCGKKFIEAKVGSEYAIEVKNNSWNKILAVISVDGLNIITGNPAAHSDPGYVIDQYSSQKLIGYQYSSEKVATFKFGNFGSGYASSKNDGSNKNVGVIGVVIWDEVPKPLPLAQLNNCNSIHWISPPIMDTGITLDYFRTSPPIIDYSTCIYGIYGNPDNSAHCLSSLTNNDYTQTVKMSADIETQWGESKNYKVKDVSFERQSIIFYTDIYYASRESLIAMGIDLNPERKVSFPQSFPNHFAKPPAGWHDK